MNGKFYEDCRAKVRFETYSKASAILRQRNHNGKKHRETRRVYHCRWCGGFHLGGVFLRPQKSRHAPPD